MNALTPNERREMSFRLKHSPALRGGTHWFNRVTLVQKIVQVNFNNSEYGYFKLTGVLGNGQRPCCPLPCEFSQKCGFCENSLLLYLPAILGGGGTDANF